MSSDQFIPISSDGISPQILSCLHSSDTAERLLGLLVLLRRTNPVSIQVLEHHEPMCPSKLTDLLGHTVQKLRRRLEDEKNSNFGFRLRNKLPKKVKIGEKFAIEAEIIDRKGNVSKVTENSQCRLRVVSERKTEECVKRGKRLREEVICGVTEVNVDSVPGPSFTDIYFAQSSSLEPRGVFTLELECPGISSLRLPSIRVLPD